MRATTIVFSTLCVALLAGPALASPGGKGAGNGPHHFHWQSPEKHFQFFLGHSGRLGLEVYDVSEGVRRALGAPADHGVLVNEVQPDSAAAEAGVRAGDVLVTVDGDRIDDAMSIYAALDGAKKGETAALEVVRKGKRVKLKATLKDDPHRSSSGFGFDVFGKLGGAPWGGGRSLDRETEGRLEKKLEQMQKRLEEMEKKLD